MISCWPYRYYMKVYIYVGFKREKESVPKDFIKEFLASICEINGIGDHSDCRFW